MAVSCRWAAWLRISARRFRFELTGDFERSQDATCAAPYPMLSGYIEINWAITFLNMALLSSSGSHVRLPTYRAFSAIVASP
jgi:hypothetical protein